MAFNPNNDTQHLLKLFPRFNLQRGEKWWRSLNGKNISLVNFRRMSDFFEIPSLRRSKEGQRLYEVKYFYGDFYLQLCINALQHIFY